MYVEQMSHLQRRLTPLVLAEYLVAQVRNRYGSFVVAALWVDSKGPYVKLPGVEAWTVQLDATRYRGPWPIVAHPPCGPWGKFKWRSREDKSHGELAMYLVHQWGGVVEQPLGSQLFKGHGLPGHQVDRIDLCDYGFAAPKPTILYWG